MQNETSPNVETLHCNVSATAAATATATAPAEPTSFAKPFSEFAPPIYRVKPCAETTLKKVYERIISDVELKARTEKVWLDNDLKSIILPSITPSCTVNQRADDQTTGYSNVVHFDFDHLTDKYNLDLDEVKQMLADDKVLNFSLIHNSPSWTGLKAYITVKDGRAEEHPLYYSAGMDYLAKIHHLTADSACRNISRACFLAHDPKPYYSVGWVDRVVLLAMVPAVTVTEKDAMNRVSAATPPPYVSTATSVPEFGKPTYSVGERPSDLLNRMPQVLERSKRDLKADGWIENGELWRRPGKNGGSSAIFNYFEREDMYFFTNFSSNSPHFGIRGYAPVQLISELEFGGNFLECITQLAHEYL